MVCAQQDHAKDGTFVLDIAGCSLLFALCSHEVGVHLPLAPCRCLSLACRCLAAQLALGKPIFGGRTRAQQLEYVFKCCGSPGQGRWPEGNKAPLYRHLRPTDKEGKSLHFKPRLAKVGILALQDVLLWLRGGKKLLLTCTARCRACVVDGLPLSPKNDDPTPTEPNPFSFHFSCASS